MQKNSCRQHKKGFTLVEVGLFLAITGVIIVGVIATTSGQINRHRYDDTVQDFATFLMGLYSSASNAQNLRDCTDATTNPCGKSGDAAYGIFAVFGRDDTPEFDPDKTTTVYTYNLQGQAEFKMPTKDNNNLLQILSADYANITLDKDSAGQYISQSHTMLWGGQAQSTNNNFLYRGAVAIIRSPLDSTLHTFVYDAGEMTAMMQNDQRFNEVLTSGKEDPRSQAHQDDVDFCVWSKDLTGNRRDVRIHKSGRTANAVEIMPRDEESNRCI